MNDRSANPSGSAAGAGRLALAGAVGTLLAAGCAGAHPTPESAPAGAYPFAVSSLRSSYGIAARFSGTVAVRDGWAHVVISSGELRAYQRDPEHYRALRDTLRFDVAIPPGTRADRAWVTLVLEWPIDGDFASYESPTAVPLAANADGTGTAVPWTGVAATDAQARCR
jgi:hypothetical protein